MDKIKILLAYKAFPMTMAHYFRRALERRNDVELVTVGEFYGQWIPWASGMTIPMKYPNQIDIPLPRGMDRVPYEMIRSSLPWKPDLVLNVDSNFHFTTKPNVPYAVVATDPHVLGDWYSQVRPLADVFFNMQLSYIQGGDVLLPYAFDPFCHYPMDVSYSDGCGELQSNPNREYDCAIVGLHYPQRDEWVSRLRGHGVKVNYRIGDIFDEYREENNKAWIGLNWSSLQDVTARVFEICAMRLVPVLNRLPGLDALGFEDGRHYLGFSNMEEAVEKILWAINHREFAEAIALNAYQFVYQQDFTWDRRVKDILTTMKLLPQL